jgi:hypothetical protein
MTATEERLIQIGNALARSLGHQFGCPKNSGAVPCICVRTLTQAQALSDWEHLVDQIKEQ